MPQPTPVEIIDAVQVFIGEYLERPPEELIYEYDPGVRCDDAYPGEDEDELDRVVWRVHVRNAFPEDDGFRLNLVERLYEKFGIIAQVELAWR